MINVALGEIYNLPRGGSIIHTSEGYVQVGSPPETVKDSMSLEKSVPEIFCLPQKLFNRDKGISVAEIEFPLYFNFFMRKKKTKILCTTKQALQFKAVLRESLLGPEILNLQNDYDEASVWPVADLAKETEYFLNGMNLSHVVDFIEMKEGEVVTFNSLQISLRDSRYFVFTDPNAFAGEKTIDSQINYNVTFDLGHTLSEPFHPPRFGVTCLGPSHGFDPVDNTSGFILWINGRGVMVDPPVNTTEWLRKSNVSSKLIDSVILTHVHADHDAGTFQKVLEQDKITVYTTRTIMESWLNKYTIITDMTRSELYTLFDFSPVLIGQKINIHGAWFHFNYTLHSIPTIGFKAIYRDKTFVYSSDHLNLPEKHKEMYENGVISKARYEEFSSFPWEESSVIYHEAGVPPLHTPISWLITLPEEIKKKTTIYHIAKKDFIKEKGLSLATFGIGDTLTIDVTLGPFEAAYEIIDSLARVAIFKDLSILEIKDLLALAAIEKIPRGEKIIAKNEYGNKFYVVLSGAVSVGDFPGDPSNKHFGSYQSFGEASLLLNKPRAANVWAESDLELLVLSRSSFLTLISGTRIEEKLKRIAINRDEESWDALKACPIFDKLTSTQKTEFELLLVRENITTETVLIENGKPLNSLYLVHSGKVEIQEHSVVHHCKKGDFAGSYRNYEFAIPSTQKCIAQPGAIVFRIESYKFKKFIKKNPGVYFRFSELMK